VVLSGLSWCLNHWKIIAPYYLLAIFGAGLLGLGILYVASPSFVHSILNQFNVFKPSLNENTINEMRPILFPAGYFTLSLIWGNFTTGLFLSIISLGLLIYLLFKRGRGDYIFVILWSMVTLVATLVMRRMALFYAINVALLTGYLSVVIYYGFRFLINYVTGRNKDYVSLRILESTGFQSPMAASSFEVPSNSDYYRVLGVPRNATHKQIKKAHSRLVSGYQTGRTLTDEDKGKLKEIDLAYSVLSDPGKRAAYEHSEYGTVTRKKNKDGLPKKSNSRIASRLNVAVAGVSIFFLVFFPNFKPAFNVVADTASLYSPNDAWCSSLTWLRENSPEPYGNTGFYYDTYQTTSPYSETAYSVTAWWDYGYWIMRISHRFPSCDPGGGNREAVANLLVAQNETAANEQADKLNTKYIIIDEPIVTTKFYALATYAGTDSKQYMEVYYQPIGGQLVPNMYFYPDYYRSLAARLYFFDGKKGTYNGTSVISYVEKVNQDGMRYKEITSTQSFSTFEEAVTFLSKQTSGNYRIASPDPLTALVPLDKLEHYKLVYSSTQSSQGSPNVRALKIFEYSQQ
jgi:asparagine N-glycosylation enzyme membrane subunit Stt3